MKPVIAITMSHDVDRSRDWINQVFVAAIAEAGGLPLLLPNNPVAGDLLTRCHGLLLTGGGDFDPQTYGQSNVERASVRITNVRDTIELALIHQATQRSLPVLGICRGMQALAIAHHGALIQDIESAMGPSALIHRQREPGRVCTHSVAIANHSLLQKIVSTSTLSVNSLHHQAVASAPEGFIVSARSEDDIIEAIEKPDAKFVLGVQWHPEHLVGDWAWARSMFATFVDAADQFQKSV